MNYRTIALIAAMPEEIDPFLRRAGACAKEKIDRFDAWRFIAGGRGILLLRSGMGPGNALAAARALIAAASPDLLINFGFAGGLTGGTVVGNIVVANRLLLYRERLFSEQAGIAAEISEELTGILAGSLHGEGPQILRGTFITASQILRKKEMASLLPPGAANPVLEMETAAVAQAAGEGNVPLIAIRAISDGAEEELGFTISEFTDSEMNIRLGKVLWTVAKRPWIVPQLLRLSGNSRIAGKSLAMALAALLGAL
jgi:adenosylhomocysteine nucleosidase